MSFEDLNKNESPDNLKRLKDSFDSLISDLRSIVPEISEKRKSLRDEQAAEIDRIYAAQRNLDFKKEFVDPDPIAHVEKFTEAGPRKNMKKEPGIPLPELDIQTKERIVRLLRDFSAAKVRAIEGLRIAKEVKSSIEEIKSREEFLKYVEKELKASEDVLREYVDQKSAKFLENIVKDMDSRERGE